LRRVTVFCIKAPFFGAQCIIRKLRPESEVAQMASGVLLYKRVESGLTLI
jgi:hypothetical protein